MIYPTGSSVFQTIAGRFRCNRATCEFLSEFSHMAIPLLGATATGFTANHFWKNDQRILAACSIAFLSLSTAIVWVAAIKWHQNMFPENSFARRRIVPSPLTNIEVTVATPA